MTDSLTMNALAVLIALCLVGSSVGSTVTWTFYNDTAAACGAVGGDTTPNPVTGFPQDTCTKVYHNPASEPAEMFVKVLCSTTNYTAHVFGDSNCSSGSLAMTISNASGVCLHDSAPNTTAYKITCNAPATTTAHATTPGTTNTSPGGTPPATTNAGGTPPATTNGVTALPGSTTASPANSLQSAVALVVAAAAVLYI